jgi:DNA-binding transcriptional LysR family regulator
MELRQLRYFVAVAEHESFTRASEHLLIAQPALSAQIAKLEDELGVALFEKIGRGVRLTGPGHLVLVEAQRTLADAEALVRIARAGAEGAVGTLRVGYSRIFPFRAMTAVLHAFRKHRPHIALELREHDPIKHLVLVRSRELDCAFSRLPDGEEDEVATYPLVAVQTMVALPRGHRLGLRTVGALHAAARKLGGCAAARNVDRRGSAPTAHGLGRWRRMARAEAHGLQRRANRELR